ncbi:hypothetical protein C1646_815063 [Rhizophagus diaphanus]|nr:hypothetical protein C1646_815063 [Rhizophagus diaphanus] [Rhizophagus sp. MUCL 43196]
MASKKLKKLFSLSLIIVVIIVFSIYYDINNFSVYINKVRKSEEPPYPKVPGIKKIDVGQGEDTWILTEKKEVTFITGTVLKRRSLYSSEIQLVRGVYDSSTDNYSWDLTPGHFYQASCAFHDYSLWAICEDYVYLYINKFKKILRSEVVFIYIKALSKQHAIGIDSDNTLWEYINGTWTWVRSNVKSASINYSNDVYYVDNNNLIYKKPKDENFSYYYHVIIAKFLA